MTLAMDEIRLGDTVRLRNGELVVVSGVYESYGDRNGEYPGPWVKGPGWSERYLLSDVTEIAARNPRICRLCGNGVTARNPETDFCSICFYTGRAFQDMHAQRIAKIEKHLPEGWAAMVEHTGGGCFWLAVRNDDDKVYYCATDGGASLPEPDEGWGLVCRYHEDEDHADYEGAIILGVQDENQHLTEKQVAEAIVADIGARA